MSPSNTTRQRSTRRQQSQSRTDERPTPSSIFPSVLRLRMPSIFNIVRASIYAAVLVWTVICLALAVHLKGILVSSDLTRFIPFAIFVCCASLLLVLALLGFGLWGNRNPISTRIELGCLGLAGVLWLALGAFLVSSESEAADVECFSSATSTQPVDMPGFNTETYHAQYRVIEAFSFFNVILIWAFIIFLLVLAVRHHRWGNTEVWLSSVTAFPWFAGADAQTGKLPAPVTAQRSRSQSRRAPPPPPATEKPAVSRRPTGGSRTYERDRGREGMREREGGRERDVVRAREGGRERGGERERYRSPTRQPSRHNSTNRRRSPTRNEEATHVYWMPHKTPDQAHVSENRRPRDKYHRGASPRR